MFGSRGSLKPCLDRFIVFKPYDYLPVPEMTIPSLNCEWRESVRGEEEMG